MSSEGPYGRHGFNANPSGYGGGGASYSQPPGAGGAGYAAPSYGQPSGQYGASYSAPGSGGYAGGQYGQGAPMDYNQVGWNRKPKRENDSKKLFCSRNLRTTLFASMNSRFRHVAATTLRKVVRLPKSGIQIYRRVVNFFAFLTQHPCQTFHERARQEETLMTVTRARKAGKVSPCRR